jgi:hypothetical protein
MIAFVRLNERIKDMQTFLAILYAIVTIYLGCTTVAIWHIYATVYEIERQLRSAEQRNEADAGRVPPNQSDTTIEKK